MINSADSPLGLSLVKIATSDPVNKELPIIGRLLISRSPPHPSKAITLPVVKVRAVASTRSTASGVCA